MAVELSEEGEQYKAKLFTHYDQWIEAVKGWIRKTPKEELEEIYEHLNLDEHDEDMVYVLARFGLMTILTIMAEEIQWE